MPPKKDNKVLHFFPGQKKMMWVVNGLSTITVEAWGGEPPDPKTKYGIMKPRKTTPGNYVIYSVATYRTKTWPFSRITWGTSIKLSSDGEKVLYKTGDLSQPWKPITDLIREATPDAIRGYYYQLYGEYKVPDRWVFNDFGVKAIRYFQDPNHNKRLDKKEGLSGEMIHTTPDNEAETTLGKEVKLESSHGCIHLKPLDRDKLEKAGAFTKGTDLTIHKYDETIPLEFTH
jgi:L,D-transpeptidase catalytic domain